MYVFILFLLLFVGLPPFSWAETNPFTDSSPTMLELQHELVDMAKRDQDVRKALGNAGWDNAPEALLEKLNTVDEQNTARIKVILNSHPTLSKAMIGIEGMSALFLLVQHSPDDTFQARMLPFFEKAYFADEGISGQQLALLTDRVRLKQGKKQLYGTQADIVEGVLTIQPIEDDEQVDIRRADMGMPPLSQYIELLKELYGIKGRETKTH